MVWPAVIAGAAVIGAGLLQGIFQQKQAEEERARQEQMRAEDELRKSPMMQIQAPLQASQSQSGALQQLANNWRGGR